MIGIHSFLWINGFPLCKCVYVHFIYSFLGTFLYYYFRYYMQQTGGPRSLFYIWGSFPIAIATSSVDGPYWSTLNFLRKLHPVLHKGSSAILLVVWRSCPPSTPSWTHSIFCLWHQPSWQEWEAISVSSWYPFPIEGQHGCVSAHGNPESWRPVWC